MIADNHDEMQLSNVPEQRVCAGLVCVEKAIVKSKLVTHAMLAERSSKVSSEVVPGHTQNAGDLCSFA